MITPTSSNNLAWWTALSSIASLSGSTPVAGACTTDSNCISGASTVAYTLALAFLAPIVALFF
jgi:hypothetical protein